MKTNPGPLSNFTARGASQFTFPVSRILFGLVVLLQIASALFLTGCARYAHGSAKVAVGMTRAEVQRACGEPYSRTSRGAVEHWFYHDSAWDDSERTWEPAGRYTDVAFVGGAVASFGPVNQPHH